MSVDVLTIAKQCRAKIDVASYLHFLCRLRKNKITKVVIENVGHASFILMS